MELREEPSVEPVARVFDRMDIELGESYPHVNIFLTKIIVDISWSEFNDHMCRQYGADNYYLHDAKIFFTTERDAMHFKLSFARSLRAM